MTTRNSEDNAPPLRARLKAARQAMTPAQRDRGGLLMRARLFTWLGNRRESLLAKGEAPPRCIAAFWPMPEEPDMRPLMHKWVQESGLTLCLPVVVERDAPLVFHRWTPASDMVDGAFGIARPAHDDPVRPDVILVPTLGFTADGQRLGYGAGYYDRTLAGLRGQGCEPTTIGLAWANATLPADYRPAPHDQRLDAILTEDGWTPSAPGEPVRAPTRSLFSTRL